MDPRILLGTHCFEEGKQARKVGTEQVSLHSHGTKNFDMLMPSTIALSI